MDQYPRLVLRAALSADHAELIRVWRRAVEETHGFLTVSDIDELQGQIRDQVLPSLSLTVALQRDVIVGWIGVQEERVEALFVDPSSHGHGIGSALLTLATEALREVTLDVNEQNPGAVTFYLKNGFRLVGRSPLDSDGRPFPLIHMQRP